MRSPKRKAVQHERCRHKPHRASYGSQLLSDAAGNHVRLAVRREIDGTIHEPACDKGHISRELEAFGCRVVSTDLNDWGYGLPGLQRRLACLPGQRRPRKLARSVSATYFFQCRRRVSCNSLAFMPVPEQSIGNARTPYHSFRLVETCSFDDGEVIDAPAATVACKDFEAACEKSNGDAAQKYWRNSSLFVRLAAGKKLAANASLIRDAS